MILFLILAVFAGLFVGDKVYWAIALTTEYNKNFRKISPNVATFAIRTVAVISGLATFVIVLAVGSQFA